MNLIWEVVLKFIPSVHEFQVTANTELENKVKINSSWFHAKNTYELDQLTFDFNTYYSDPMKLTVSFSTKATGVEFEKLKLSFIQNFNSNIFENLELKYFKINKKQNYFELEKFKN